MRSVSGSGERLLAILGLFSEENPEWTPEDMMQALGFSRPTLYRYLKTLKDAGYLVSLPQAGYTLGPRVTELDFLMRRSDPLITAADTHLKAIAEAFIGSAFVVRFYDQKMLCVASKVSAPAPRSSYPRGRPMPIGKGAVSRAIVAFLPPKDRAALVSDYLDAFVTSGIGTTKDAVLTELKRIRRDRVATARGEVTPGLIGVAAPILAGDGTPIGALCLSTEEATLSQSQLDALRETVRDHAEAISDALSQPARQAIA
ncbi:IclR family transcriptional regulator [Marivita sp.]|uniref:IclR family transcriptional regulator n=1 Tax=Marivita sp. TaxID=2003365 RepID=UPI003F6C6342